MTTRRRIAGSLVLVLLASFAQAARPATALAQLITFKAISFNVGTSTVLPHDDDSSDGWTSVQAEISDDHYGNGLAWSPAIDAAAAFIAQENPEIVAFQEIFDPEECASIPVSVWPGFICESWTAGDLSVAELVLGPAYQIACNLGRSDECLAVRTDFGSFEGCLGSLCRDGLDGAVVQGCSRGSRVGRGRIRLANGGELTVVNMHGTSGITSGDMACRELQIDQLFDDFDGTPAADGAYNLVLGDFNTDPVRLIVFDSSAQRLTSYVGSGASFDYLSDSGPLDPPTYQDFVTLDHVISDSITGGCEVAGLTPGVPAVFETTYFDHKPITCVPEPSLVGSLPIGSLLLVGGVRLRRR